MVPEGPSAIQRLRTRASEEASETAFALLDGLWHGPVGIAVLDRALRFVQVNEPFAELSGTSPAGHAGEQFADVAAGAERSAREELLRLEDACRVVAETGRPFLNLVLGLRSGGRTREWLCSVFPVRAPDGTSRGVLAIVSDATNDREREAALARARDDAQRALGRLERLLDVTAALSQARTAEDVMSVLVLQADRAFGVVSAVAFVRKGDQVELVAAMGPAEDRRERLASLPLDAPIPAARAARDGIPFWFESAEALDAAFPGFVHSAPHLSAFGSLAALPLRVGETILGAVAFGFAKARSLPPEERALLVAAAEQCALALDRARLLDAEREAREAEARSRALLDAVVENAPVGIGFLDPELRFGRVNRLLADMNGLLVEDHLGKTMAELFPGLPAAEVERAWRDVLETGRPVLDTEVQGETPAAPGKRRTWLESWYPVRSGDEILGVGTLVREVTAERAAEEFQRNVLGVVGHDLRNPLSALATSARVLVASEQLPRELRRVVERIVANAVRMDRIISVLLDYARVRGGQRIPLHRTACDLAAIAELAADECEAAHPGRVVRRAGEGDVTGSWDPDRVAQVIVNLLSNAIDYSPAGSGVELSWRADDAGAVLEIANGGPPIPPEVVPSLFEPFRRAERQRAGGKDGLGLGLFIARAIANAHGGDLGVRSAPGERTVFTLRLPRGAERR
ncbi:MAG TPA: PAS domain-containing protein [Anaeromyxobacter sp.]